MQSLRFEALPKEDIERHEVLEPVTPDQPLIYVGKKKERAYFEAQFALELAGVTKSRMTPEANNKQEEQSKTATAKYRRSLITGLAQNQGLQFVYAGGKDSQGNPHFNWKVVGLSSGLSSEDAVFYARQLFQNINVMLKAVRHDYVFAPVARGGLGKDESNDAWIGTIRPMGIEIVASDTPAVGFMRGNNESEERSVIVVPYDDKSAAETFDAVTAGAFGCPSDVKVILSVTPFMLSDNNLKSIAAALKWLMNKEVKQIRFQSASEEGVEDEELLKRLKNNLEIWMKNPSGYRMTCNVLSPEPIPGSYLSIIGRDLFNCPVSIGTRKRDDQKEREEAKSEVDILDLRDCINGASTMPALFPDKASLLDCGVSRIFSLPQVNLTNSGILLGHIATSGQKEEIHFARPDRSRHAYVIGATGTGKSTLLYSMLKQDIENGEGCCLIDPHGDLYWQILNSIPERRINEVVLIDPCDFGHSAGINFLECNGTFKPVQMNFISNELINIFHMLYDLRATGGPMFEQYLRSSLLLVMDNSFPGSTILDVVALLEDKDYRRFLLDRCHSPHVKNFWLKQAERAGGEAALENMVPYLTSKLNQFTTNALLRPIIGQSTSTINFREAMDNGSIILANLSKGLLGQMDAQLCGALLINKIFLQAMERITQKPANRRPFFLYVDEFSNFCTTDSIAYLISEARKFGLSFVAANQTLSQLNAGYAKNNILESILGNVGSLIMTRLGAIDAEKMCVYTKPELNAQDLQELPDFMAAAKILNNNRPTRPFVFKAMPMPEQLDSPYVQEIIAKSRKKYTRPTDEVEKAINDRREKYSVESDVF